MRNVPHAAGWWHQRTNIETILEYVDYVDELMAD